MEALKSNGAVHKVRHAPGGGGVRKCDSLWQGGGGQAMCDVTHLFFKILFLIFLINFLVEFNSFKNNFQKFCETFELVLCQNSMKCVSPECVVHDSSR